MLRFLTKRTPCLPLDQPLVLVHAGAVAAEAHDQEPDQPGRRQVLPQRRRVDALGVLPVLEAERRRDLDCARPRSRSAPCPRRRACVPGGAVEAVAEREHAGAGDPAHVRGGGVHCPQRHTSGTPRACAVTRLPATLPACLLRTPAASCRPSLLLVCLLAPGAAQRGGCHRRRPAARRRRPRRRSSAADAVQVGAVPRLRVVVVHVGAAHRAAALRALRRSRAVRYAEPRAAACGRSISRRPIPAAPQQWGLDAIGVAAAWAVTRGAGVVVAVVDTGVAADARPRRPPAARLERDRPQRRRGRRQRARHARRRHRRGGRGQRPGRVRRRSGGVDPARSRCSTPTGTGSDVDVAAGIVWAADHGARIVNLSLGGSETVDRARRRRRLCAGQGRADRRRGGQRRRQRRRARAPRRRARGGRRGLGQRARAVQRGRPRARSRRARRRHPAADARRRRRLRRPLVVRAPRWRRRTSRESPRSRSLPAARRRRPASSRLLTRTALDLGAPGRIPPTAPGSCARTRALGVAVP